MRQRRVKMMRKDKTERKEEIRENKKTRNKMQNGEVEMRLKGKRGEQKR